MPRWLLPQRARTERGFSFVLIIQALGDYCNSLQNKKTTAEAHDLCK
jgi:hypothetical protein